MRDVIVIGAGGGGAVVAKELAAHGLDVLVLEAGPRFPDPEREWRHFENDANDPVTGYFRWGPSDRTKAPWARETPQQGIILQVAGVGGTTKHYYANSPRAYPGCFAGYSGADSGLYDRAFELPFSYRSLIPYYEWVEHTLPVETAAMGTKEQVFLDAASKLGIPVQTTKDTLEASYRPQENAILQPRGTAGRTTDASKLTYPQAQGCTFCGFCVQGCYEPRKAPRNLHAKRSTDTAYIPMALTADAWSKGGRPVTLLTDAFATKVATGATAHTVTWREGVSGNSASDEAKVVVMAGGTIENPRLWLNSRLPNPNGWVGRGYTDHFFDWITGVMPYYTGSSKGAGSSARVEFPGYGALQGVGLPPALQAFSDTMSDAGINDVYLNGHTRTPGTDGDGRRVGLALKQLMQDVDRLLNVFVMTGDYVDPQNRVTLSTGLPPDEHGQVPKVTINYRQALTRTAQSREYLAGRAIELLRKAGAKQIFRLNWPPVSMHIHSTMRMGSDPSTSVLDESGEARFVKRLFVADNSALPNSLGGPNPTLTTQALATRTAETIFTRYFGGHPYVRGGTPLQSIDPAVTAAVVARGP